MNIEQAKTNRQIFKTNEDVVLFTQTTPADVGKRKKGRKRKDSVQLAENRRIEKGIGSSSVIMSATLSNRRLLLPMAAMAMLSGGCSKTAELLTRWTR